MIVHIGTTKTGSTAIQKVLARSRAEMLAQGVVYPRSPGHERHAYLAVSATTDRKRIENADRGFWKGVSPSVQLAKFRTEFEAEMENLPTTVKRILISAEEFSALLLDVDGIRNLHAMLAKYADSISIVVYLRRPDHHWTSLYSEKLRWGGVQPPSLLGANPPPHAYDYDGLLDRWASVFGDRAIKPRIYEQRQDRRFDVVTDFLEVCELSLGVSSQRNVANSNKALSFAAQMVLVELASRLRVKKRANVSSSLWQHLVDAASAALPGRSWQPTQQEAAGFVDRYAENHEAVRRRWFPHRDTLFSTDFSDLPAEQMQLDMAAMQEACMRLILQTGEKITALEDELAKTVIPAAEQAGDDRRLHRNLIKRIELKPQNIEARLKLAQLLLKTGDTEAATRQVKAALKIDPRNAEALALERRFGAGQDASKAQ